MGVAPAGLWESCAALVLGVVGDPPAWGQSGAGRCTPTSSGAFLSPVTREATVARLRHWPGQGEKVLGFAQAPCCGPLSPGRAQTTALMDSSASRLRPQALGKDGRFRPFKTPTALPPHWGSGACPEGDATPSPRAEPLPWHQHQGGGVGKARMAEGTLACPACCQPELSFWWDAEPGGTRHPGVGASGPLPGAHITVGDQMAPTFDARQLRLGLLCLLFQVTGSLGRGLGHLELAWGAGALLLACGRVQGRLLPAGPSVPTCSEPQAQPPGPPDKAADPRLLECSVYPIRHVLSCMPRATLGTFDPGGCL